MDTTEIMDTKEIVQEESFLPRDFFGMLRVVNQFCDWINERAPLYFSHHPIKIYIKDNTNINLISPDKLLSKEAPLECDKYSDKSFSYQDVIDALHSIFPEIKIDLCNKVELLSQIDIVFDSLLKSCRYYRDRHDISSIKNSLNLSPETSFIGQNELAEFGLQYLNSLKISQENSDCDDFVLMYESNKISIKCRHGEELEYYKVGSGPAVVLIGAFGVNVKSWQWIIRQLSEDYTVLFWECRGLTGFKCLGDDFVFGVEEQSKDVLEVIDNEKALSVDLVSWCSGAKSAIWIAEKHKHLVGSICFIAPNFTPFWYDENISTLWDSEIASLADMLLGNPAILTPYLQYLKSNLTASNYLSDYDKHTSHEKLKKALGMFSPKYKDLFSRPYHSIETLRNYAKIVKEFYLHKAIDQTDIFKAHVLFIVSDNDSVANPAQSWMLHHKISNSEYLNFPATSHFLLYENGRIVANAVSEFLKKK